MKLLSYLQKTHHITRRDFEEMIKEGVIHLNSTQVTDFSQEVQLQDTLEIHLPSGEIYTEIIEKIPVYRPKLVLFHKPKGYVVSKKDQHNKTIFQLLPPHRRENYYYIGRLDKDSTGLLLLTNDTSLVDYYENPKYNIHKVYEVVIDKPYRTKDVKKACQGLWVTEDGKIAEENEPAELLSAVSITYRRDHEKHRLVMTLNEGKKRHIRRLLKALGYKVYELQRVKIGKWRLGNMKPGKWRVEKKVK